MDEYIRKQAAIDAFLTEFTKRERKNLLHTWSTVEVKYFVVDMLEKLPSAEPEVIRCKDCKWKQGSECVRFADVRPFPDDYCSRAERKEA